MGSVFFSDLAFGRVTLILLMIIIDIFLLVRRPKNAREWFFFAHFFFMTLLSLGYFIAFSVFSPYAHMRWLIAFSALFAITAHIQFGYRFPRKLSPVEANIVLVITVLLSLWSLIYYIIKMYQAPMGLNENGYESTYHSTAIPVILTVMCLWRIIVFFRQTVHSSEYPEINSALQDKSRSSVYRIHAFIAGTFTRLIRPESKASKAARSFMILTIIEFLMSALLILYFTINILPPPAFNITLNLVFTIIYLFYVVIYINRSSGSFSLVYKITGITLVTILMIVASMGYHSIIIEQRAYDELKMYQTEVMLRNADTLKPEGIPEDCSFVFAVNNDTGTRCIFSQPETRELPSVGEIISVPEGSHFFLQHSMANYYCFSVSNGKERIIAGYDYISYRQRIHRAVARQILITVISVALVILLYPLMLSISFITPIRDLLLGVEHVHSGRLEASVPIHFEDEIGEVSRAFNTMMCSVLSSRRMLQDHTDHLEDIVSARTEELSTALKTIEETQDRLIQTEKMASLGNLVAGIAHEINTPVGIALTASTYLQSIIKQTTGHYNDGLMKKSDLDSFMACAAESTVIIRKNIERASEVIQGFKQVAVDRSTDKMRNFNIGEYINDILLSLQPQIRMKDAKVSVTGDPELEIFSDPGAVAQVFSNLILNSLNHAFQNSGGNIEISYIKKDTDIIFSVSDNGAGIPADILPHIFDPFFTTKRGDGGTGLGLHIVYNIVAQKFRGKIDVTSTEGKGTVFFIKFPCIGDEFPG